ncbi:MAG: ATP-binding protein [Bryobacteraceae bacterium]|nr:ATP-binding protein [Bryobacteraceae bacterium]
MPNSVWQRLSLRTRLVVAMVVLVGSVVSVVSAFNFRDRAGRTLQEAFERASANASNINSFVLERVVERTDRAEKPPRTLEEGRQFWAAAIREDTAVRHLSRNVLVNSPYVMDVAITDSEGRILSAPDGERIGERLEWEKDFVEWQKGALLLRLWEVLWANHEYEIAKPLGVHDQKPFFYTRVVVSTAMLRTALLPELQGILRASALIVLLSIAVAAAAASVLLRPLERIHQTIDRISKGEAPDDGAAEAQPEAREIAALQRKLNLLGKQVHLAREDVLQWRSNVGQMLERLEEAVLMYDAEERLVVAGLPAERLLGRDARDLVGSPLEDLFPPGPVMEAVRQAVGQRRALRDYPWEFARDGQPMRRLMVNVEPLDRDGAGIGTLVTLRDVETRNQLEAQLDVSTRLAALSRLTGGVAHEMKNPLNAITLHLEVLRAQLSSTPPSVRGELDVISAEVNRLDRVVKTFLDFTRPVALHLQPIELEPLVRESLRALEDQATRRGIDLVVRPVRPDSRVLADVTMLKQALVHVIVNAIEAMPQGGSVEVELSGGETDVVVSVADEGEGIRPEERDKIFNLFYTTKKTGSGIGLAMAFQVLQLHHGTIECEPRGGRGTIFRLRLPALKAAPVATVGAMRNGG